MTLQPADLDRLEQLAREATPGPWTARKSGNSYERDGTLTGHSQVSGPSVTFSARYIGERSPHDLYLADRDADLVAALSPATVLALVAAARLGAAWQEAEAALPEGWQLLFWRTMSGDGDLYWLEVTETVRPEWGDGATPRVTFAHGPTPAAALLALAEALRGRGT